MDDFRQKHMDTTTKNKLIAAIAKWVATSCRPVNVVEDEGLADIIRIASNDWTYELPLRATITSHVQKLHKTEKAKVQQALEKTKAVALTGDYWTSLCNHNYLGVTAPYTHTPFQDFIFSPERRSVMSVCKDRRIYTAQR